MIILKIIKTNINTHENYLILLLISLLLAVLILQIKPKFTKIKNK